MTNDTPACPTPEKATCPNCGKTGSHFAPPSFGEEGFYTCSKPPMPEKADWERELVNLLDAYEALDADPWIDLQGKQDALRAAVRRALDEREAATLCKLMTVTKPDGPIFLAWVSDRLSMKYGESPNTDFVVALRRLATEWENRATAAEARSRSNDGET